MKSLLDTLRISFAGVVFGSSVLGVAVLGGCNESETDEHAVDQADHDDHDGHDHGEHMGHDSDDAEEAIELGTHVYAGVRGEITSLPDGSPNGGDMKIHHTHIPDFRRDDGEIPVTPDGISGMKSMTMGFPAAEGVSLDGFEVGDKIEFTFVVNWSGGRAAWEITEISKLDPATEIDYSNAKNDGP